VPPPPTFIITHRMPLDAAPDAYSLFLEKGDDCVKVVLTPEVVSGEWC